ncbi:hypothetical protein C4K25_1391 [Pseudomonas chlororaphis]|nr:hypothetical protein C4K25_1391 [Pseudomonas chlororaphis]
MCSSIEQPDPLATSLSQSFETAVVFYKFISGQGNGPHSTQGHRLNGGSQPRQPFGAQLSESGQRLLVVRNPGLRQFRQNAAH